MNLNDKYDILKRNIIIMLKQRDYNTDSIINIKLPTYGNEYDFEIKNELLVRFCRSVGDLFVRKIDHKLIIFIICFGDKSPQYYITEKEQVFYWKFFMFNILEHKYVPRFEKVINTTKFNIEHLPIILSTDVMANYYNMKHNDIYKITRNNYITYRVCRLNKIDINR
tara:strand:- start:266 stop:766 length:501 start_codon:yes stop_codon:yes gene_type:complete